MRVHQIVEDAYDAGWHNPDGVLAALIDIAENLALQYEEHEALKGVLNRLKGNRHSED